MYCLLPPYLGQTITTFMNLTFNIDGNTVGQYTRDTNTVDWVYNSSVFDSPKLANGLHTLVVQSLPGTGLHNSSFLAFDYFQYE